MIRMRMRMVRLLVVVVVVIVVCHVVALQNVSAVPGTPGGNDDGKGPVRTTTAGGCCKE